ncbi:hypothetical protein [Streptomyces sp. URMC 129]|uniref:hypothetical protein n=1 Tax=Streptomyces sp. URMC 129 TaxID=3423407 RepID=UPI003F1B2171
MTGQEPEYVFDQVQIGKGLRPLAQHGYVVVDAGTLTLLGSDRQVIAGAPLAEITAKPVRLTGGKTLAVTVNGTKYTVSPGWGRHVGFPIAGTTGDVKTAAQALLHLIETAGPARA